MLSKVLSVPYVNNFQNLFYICFAHAQVTRSLWVQFCLWASNANILLTSDFDPQYCILGIIEKNYKIKWQLLSHQGGGRGKGLWEGGTGFICF